MRRKLLAVDQSRLMKTKRSDLLLANHSHRHPAQITNKEHGQ